jgi:hypothetical protein
MIVLTLNICLNDFKTNPTLSSLPMTAGKNVLGIVVKIPQPD